MYYYMLKVLNMYLSPYNLITVNMMSTSTLNANLKFVSVDSYEYTGTGTTIFNATSPSTNLWQTNRSQSFPHYLIFSSDKLISNISINSGTSGAYLLKDFEIYVSPTLLAYTSTAWKLKLAATISSDSVGITRTFNITNDKYLIRQGTAYYTIKPEYYETGARTYTPITLSGGTIPNVADISTFGFESIDDLFISTTINDETFKPINKLYQTFDLKKYMLK